MRLNKAFYPKLALSNMKKNSKLYVPFMMAVIGTIMMFYILCSIYQNQGIDTIYAGSQLKIILGLGIYIIGFFSIIFLFYTNQFLMKQRKRELGLYNILGMGKKHIGKILFYETMGLYLFCLACGLLGGIIISKLMFLILLKILNFSNAVQFTIEVKAIYTSVGLFGGVFSLMLLFNLGQIYRSKPISLLRSAQVGEREPKTKWIITLIGFLTLGTGYGMALSIQSPLEALNWFFIAVLLVIIGTYALFIAGSIALLKAARKNKKYYYQTKHFIGVSSMIYRMKQNAVGLSNICILSTMVLIMLSTTVCLYAGKQDTLLDQYPQEIQLRGSSEENGNAEKIIEMLEKNDKAFNLEIKNLIGLDYLMYSAQQEGTEFVRSDYQSSNRSLYFISLEDYNRLSNENIILKENEVLINANSTPYESKECTIFGNTYQVMQTASKLPHLGLSMAGISRDDYIIALEKSDFYSILGKISNEVSNKRIINSYLSFDFTGDKEERSQFIEKINQALKDNESEASVFTRWDADTDYLFIYGGLLFIGCFLSVLFLMATVLIIYYKQISEGYEDQNRFRIMQQVGMSKKEVRASIKSQIMIVFFLPLATAVIHVMFAFPMISKLLALFHLTNIFLFVICTIITILIFSIIYGIVYSITAKEYYKIVN